MLKDFFSIQFAKFLLSGGIAAAVNVCSRIIYDTWLSYSIAIVLAYLTGMAVAAVLFRAFVFESSKDPVKQQLIKFSIVNIAAIIQTLMVSIGLADYLLPALHVEKFRHEIAHFFGVSTPAITSFLAHKYFTFRESIPNGDNESISSPYDSFQPTPPESD